METLQREDVIFEEPKEGDMVMYFIRNPRLKIRQTEIGIIAREFCEDQWIISGEPRYKEQVLFVLTMEAYMKHKRFTNPLAY